MPEPTPQQWADAHRYCSLDRLFQSKPNQRDAVRDYIMSVNLLGPQDTDEINAEVVNSAASWTRIQRLVERVEGFKPFLRDRLPLMARSACLSGLSHADFNGAVGALQRTLDLLTFRVSRDTTQNAGGTVTLSLSILENPQQDADEAVLFALAHEFGHSADLTLNPYNPSDPRYPAFHGAILPSLPPSTSRNQMLEYFADAFATVFLVSAAGVSRSKIAPAANFLFAAEPGGGDHPSGPDRLARIQDCLDNKC
jgi:hypothetical protein